MARFDEHGGRAGADRLILGLIGIVLFFTLHVSLFAGDCYAQIFDRVVAFVDDNAITLSDFEEQYRSALKVTPDVTQEDVLSSIINRILLLREAAKYRIEAPTPQQVMNEFIDLKLRAFVKVNESDIEDFYKKNISQFSGREYEEVRGEIEKYLAEKELNERLKELLKDLRKQAYIKIQLKPDEACLPIRGK